MANRRLKEQKKGGPGSSSWLALVAATTLGVAHADTVKTEIRVAPEWVFAGRPYRLVVQSYPSDMPVVSTLPGESKRPLGSTQLAVTAANLVRGVHVDLVELAGDGQRLTDRGLVLAWVEPGEPDLEFDARRARPAPGSLFGVAKALGAGSSDPIAIHLDQRMNG